MRNLEKTFEYDNQNRLKRVRLGPTLTGASVYDSYGRMTAKTANGQVVFYDAEFSTTAKPHAMDAATTSSGVFPAAAQTVAYTGFDKVRKIKQGNDSLCYTYGYDHQRIFMDEHVGNRHRTKRYVGNCEYITKTNGNVTDTQWLTYLTGPTGVYAVVATENGRNKIHYILKDNLGSWTTITDEEGSVEQQLSYDAWGNLRNPNYWTGFFSGVPMFDRGFTGHEHLTAFGLINMNGRMYDPVMSSFLSVDQYVQSPENAQGFNRYAYCMNNPLKYIDPSGWRCIGGITGYTPNSATNDPYAYVDNRYLEPRDFCSAYGMFNMEFYGNTSGFGAGIGAGGGYLGSYGYQVTHRANSVYNHYFKTALLSLIQDWQANPSRSTGEALINAGITNLTVGEVYGNYQGSEGFRNSYYTWTDSNDNTHSAETFYEYVGGNSNGVFTLSNQPLEMYNNKAELFFNSSNSFRYDGQWRTTPMIHTMQGGQHVKVVVSNNNPLGVALTLQDKSTYYYEGLFRGKKYPGDNYAFSLMPFQTKSFDFYHFGEFPYTWQFELDTPISSVANVSVLFYSDWKPGMPPSRR